MAEGGWRNTPERGEDALNALMAIPPYVLRRRSALQPQAEEPDAGDVVRARDVGAIPFLAVLAFERELAGEQIGERYRCREAVVHADIATIDVARVRELCRADEPATEGMIDLDADLAREHAGNQEKRRFRGGGGGEQLSGGERARRPHQRSIDEQAAEIRQWRDIHLVDIPDRELAGERARKIDIRAGLGAVSRGIAIELEAVERKVVHALVGGDLGKRPQPGRKL